MTVDTGRLAVALLVGALFVGAVTPVAVALNEPREEPADTRPPVRVYVSETLNISATQLTGGGTVGPNETTFSAVGGGPSFTVDPTSADFDGVEPGAYYATSDEDVRAELRVIRPQVGRLELRDEQQRTVTNGRTDPADLERLYVRADFNFDDADRLDITVVGPSGAEVANGSITSSGERESIDLGEPTPGVYTVTVAGSNIEAGNRTATVRVLGPTPTATPTPTPTATPTPTPTATPTPTPTPTTAGDGVGFGVVVALVGVLAAAHLARRR